MENFLTHSSNQNPEIRSLEQPTEITNVQEVAKILSVEELETAQKMVIDIADKMGIRPPNNIDGDQLAKWLFWIPTPFIVALAAYGALGKDVDLLSKTAVAQVGVIGLTKLREKHVQADGAKIQSIVNNAIITLGEQAVSSGYVSKEDIAMGQPTAQKLAELTKANQDYNEAVENYPAVQDRYQKEHGQYCIRLGQYIQLVDNYISSLDTDKIIEQITSAAGANFSKIESDLTSFRNRVLVTNTTFETVPGNIKNKINDILSSLSALNNDLYEVETTIKIDETKRQLTTTIKLVPKFFSETAPVKPMEPELKDFLPKFEPQPNLSPYFPRV